MKTYPVSKKKHTSTRWNAIKSLIVIGFVLLISAFAIAAFQQSGTMGRPMNGAQFPEFAQDGRIWIPVYSDNNVRIVEKDGRSSTFSPISTGLDASGRRYRIENPSGCAVVGGIVYITCDSFAGDRFVFKFKSSDGSPLQGFKLPYSVGDIDSDQQGRLYIAEKTGHSVHIIDANGRDLEGSPIAIPRSYENFRGLAVSNNADTLYIVSEKPGTVLRATGRVNGNSVTFSRFEPFITGLNDPGAVNIGPDNRVYVSEGGSNRILVYEQNGRFIQEISGGTPRLRLPRGVAFTDNGKMVVAQFSAAPLQVWATDIKAVAVTSPETTPVVTAGSILRIQVGAFSNADNARAMKEYIQKMNYSDIEILTSGTDNLNRLVIGKYKTLADAENVAKELQGKIDWPGFNGAWIINDKNQSVKFFPAQLTATNKAAPTVTKAEKGSVGYWLQVAAYASGQNASGLKAAIEKLGYANVHVIEEPALNNVMLKKVRMGPFASINDAKRISEHLTKSLVFPNAGKSFWIFAAKVTDKVYTPTIAYRVLVNQYRESLDGAKLKAILESQGRYPVFLDNIPPTWDVTVGNYPNEKAAQGLLKELINSGYPNAKVVKAGEVVSSLLSDEEKKSIDTKKQEAEKMVSQGQPLEAIAQLESILQKQQDNEEIIKQLKSTIESLSSEQRKKLETEKLQKAEAEDKQNQVRQLNDDAANLYKQGNMDSAIAKWESVLKIDPRNANANYFLPLARKFRENLPDPVKAEMEAKAKLNDELQAIGKEAQDAYINKNYELARSKYQEILSKDPNSPIGRTASDAIAKIEAEQGMKETQNATTSSDESGWKTYVWYAVYAIIGIALLAGIIIGIQKAISAIKARPAKPKKAKEPKLPKGKKAKGLNDMIAPPVDHSAERELTEEQMEQKKQGEEYLRQGLEAMERKEWDKAESLLLTAAALDPNNPEPRGKVERLRMLRKEGGRLNEAEQKVTTAQEVTPPTPAPATTQDAIPTISINRPAVPSTPPTTAEPAPQISISAQPSPEATIAGTQVTPPPAVPVVVPPVTPTEITPVFEQSYDSDTLGEPVSGWMGEYSHASLKVSDKVVANNMGYSLAFEKPNGSASTHYRCKFPDMKGKFAVEFDINCETKNKYFLGLYIESDEDFRKAVHTVIHTTEDGSNSSLRLQGESVPYQLGSWAHVKYIMNLNDSTVDAFINNQTVVQSARIPGNPEHLNTLSIRDNPATTAIMYIDNIKIYSL